MNLASFRGAQDLITTSVVRAVLALLRTVAHGQRSERQFRALVDALLPTVLTARSASAALAREVYAA